MTTDIVGRQRRAVHVPGAALNIGAPYNLKCHDDIRAPKREESIYDATPHTHSPVFRKLVGLHLSIVREQFGLRALFSLTSHTQRVTKALFLSYSPVPVLCYRRLSLFVCPSVRISHVDFTKMYLVLEKQILFS